MISLIECIITKKIDGNGFQAAPSIFLIFHLKIVSTTLLFLVFILADYSILTYCKETDSFLYQNGLHNTMHKTVAYNFSHYYIKLV